MKYKIQSDQNTYRHLCDTHRNIVTSSLIKNGVRAKGIRNGNYHPARERGSLIHALLLEEDQLGKYFTKVSNEFDYKLFDKLIANGLMFCNTGCQHNVGTKSFDKSMELAKKALEEAGENPDAYYYITEAQFQSIKECSDIIKENKTPINGSMMDEALAQVNIVRRDMEGMNIFGNPNMITEQAFICDLDGYAYTYEEADAEHSKILLMCKPDILVLDYVHKGDDEEVECIKYFDIKSTASSDIDMFKSQCHRLSYYFQQAFYNKVLNLGADDFGFDNPVYHGGFIAVDTEYAVMYESVNPQRMDQAMLEVDRAIAEYRLCLATGNFRNRNFYEYI